MEQKSQDFYVFDLIEKREKMSFSNILSVYKIHTESPRAQQGIYIAHAIQLLTSRTKRTLEAFRISFPLKSIQDFWF